MKTTKIWILGMNSDIDQYALLYLKEPREAESYEYLLEFNVSIEYPIEDILDACNSADSYPENLDVFLRGFYKKYP